MRRGRLDVLVGGWLERHEELPTGRHAGGHYHINVSTRLGVLDPDLAAGSGAGGHDDGEGLGVGEQRGRRVLLLRFQLVALLAVVTTPDGGCD